MEGTDVSMDVDDTFPKRTKEVPADVCNISNRWKHVLIKAITLSYVTQELKAVM